MSASSSTPRRACGHGQDPAELREHPLGRHAPQLRRGRPCQRERLGVGLEVELHGHPGQAHDPQRVFQEGARVGRAQAPGAKVLDPPERVDRLAPGERLGDRVDGEVPQPQVLLEGRRAQGLEVGLPAMLGADHPPGTMVGGELEAGGCGRRRARARGRPAPRLPRGRRRRLRWPAPAAGRGWRPRPATPHGPRAPAGRARPARAPRRDGPSSSRERPGHRGAVAVVGPRHSPGEPAGDLVVDRSEAPGDLLGADPLAPVGSRSGPPAGRAARPRARPRRPPR